MLKIERVGGQWLSLRRHADFMGAHHAGRCIGYSDGYSDSEPRGAYPSLQPGTQLFPASAPAWRQQRWLAKMS
jgi:hypothetical protein